MSPGVRPTIRRAIDDDMQGILTLLIKHALPSVPGRDDFDPAKTVTFIRSCLGTSIVADAAGDIVGVSLMIKGSPWYSSTEMLRGLVFYLRRDVRISDTGMRLGRATIRAATRYNLPFVLEVTAGDDILRKDAFFRRLGMRALGGTYIFGG